MTVLYYLLSCHAMPVRIALQVLYAAAEVYTDAATAKSIIEISKSFNIEATSIL